METLLAIGAVQSLFLALVILTKKEKDASDRMLIFILCIWSLRFISYWLITMDVHLYLPRIIGIEQSLFLLDGPLLFIYVKSLIEDDQFRWKEYIGHFLPFVMVVLYSLFMWHAYSQGEIEERFGEKLLSLRSRDPGTLAYDEKFFILTVCLSLVTYGFISLYYVRRFHKRIRDSFSFTEKITKDWLNVIIISWLFFFALPLCLFLINFFTTWFPFHLTDIPLVFAFLIMIFIPAYYAFRQLNNRTMHLEMHHQEVLQQESSQVTEETPSYKKSGLKNEQAQQYQDRLEKFMTVEKPYLNPDLTLSILAEALRMSPNHLSQVLNQGLQRNFFDYINEYRVNEVKQRLASPDFAHFTLLAIAEDCGFKSKSSFNSIFKRFTSMTPSAYRKSLEDQN